MKDKKHPNAETMLLAFRASNVRSFRDRFDLSLQATAIAEENVARSIPWRHGDTASGRVKVLPAAGVFGANASGKTNVLRVMDDMRDFVNMSFPESVRHRGRKDRTLRAWRRPFRMDGQSEGEPSYYEVDIVIDGVRYEYGFEVDDHEILSEWAYKYPRGKAATIFRRDGDELEVKTPGAGPAKRLLRRDALFLSLAQAVEYEELEPLYKWFRNNLILAAASSREARWRDTVNLMTNDLRRRQVLDLLRVADLGITDATPQSPDPKQIERVRGIMKALRTAMPDDFPDVGEEDFSDFELNAAVGLFLSHKGANGHVQFDASDESLGTLVWLGLIGPVLEALANGTVLLADEIESSLHPRLVTELVRMFQKPDTNPNGAQLIFNSHEARLLGNSQADRVIGRDQVWFTEKLSDGGTRLYPLSDMNPRSDEAVARRYVEGRYGGTPLISQAEFAALAKSVANSGDK